MSFHTPYYTNTCVDLTASWPYNKKLARNSLQVGQPHSQDKYLSLRGTLGTVLSLFNTVFFILKRSKERRINYDPL